MRSTLSRLAMLLMLFSGCALQSLNLPSSSPDRPNPPPSPDPSHLDRILSAYGALPLAFEVNQGQTDPEVRFLSRGRSYTVYLTDTEAVLAFKKVETLNKDGDLPPPPKSITQTVLQMQIVGANPQAKISGKGALPGKSNYFIGSDPSQWRTDIPTYARVRYENIYSGIDLVYYGNRRQLEYDFVVAPGADPKQIELGFQGADYLETDPTGDLILKIDGGEVRLRKPVIYQEREGARQAVSGRYLLQGKNKVGFQIAAYDRSRPLIIDPVLAYSTYLGGSGFEAGNGIAVDASGNAYVTGATGSIDFPATAGVFQPVCGSDCSDIFVTKLNPAGDALLYSTYLGGDRDDVGNGIGVDRFGNVHLTGWTASRTFPTMSPLQPNLNRSDCELPETEITFLPCVDGFVAKLNGTGDRLIYSTYLGGGNTDIGRGIAVDSAGNAYVTGLTTHQYSWWVERREIEIALSKIKEAPQSASEPRH